MIKPFQVLNVEDRGNEGKLVTYQCSRASKNEDGSVSSMRIDGIIGVPPTEKDVDAYLFQALSKAGWF